MTLCERVFWMDGVGIGFIGIVGCVLFGFEVFESGQLDGHSFIRVQFSVLFLIQQKLALEVPEEIGVIMGDEGVIFPGLKARVSFEVLLEGRLRSVFGVGKH